MEEGPWSFYDVTDPEHRREAAHWVKKRTPITLLMPEDTRREDIEELFRVAGYAHVEVDVSKWPREVFVKADGETFKIRKVEEGVYRLS